jgi:hypothetical protein
MSNHIGHTNTQFALYGTDGDRPPMSQAEALQAVARVAHLPPQRVQACACCGRLLADGAVGEYGTCCAGCQAAGCDPLLGARRCSPKSEELMPNAPDTREQLAAYAHRAWARWMEYVYGRCTQNPDGSLTIPAEWVARWQQQMDRAYVDLSEAEQASDLLEADTILALLPSEPNVIVGTKGTYTVTVTDEAPEKPA